MKKNGFTLAEVLITLAIIGVVATMTLPALMTNTAEQQAKTGLKKGINVLTEAAQMSQVVEGFDFGTISSSDIDENGASLYALLAKRTAMDFAKSGTKKLISQQGSASTTASDNYAVFFRDGSALLYKPTDTTDSKYRTLLSDGLPQGVPVIYDTNGTKGPNILSNCSGVSLGATEDKGEVSKCTLSKRVIKDQFGVRLRGSFAVPNGAAAKWAFEN